MDSMDKQGSEYAAPTVRSLGSVEEMTMQQNKIGSTADAFTVITNGAIVGEVVPLP